MRLSLLRVTWIPGAYTRGLLKQQGGRGTRANAYGMASSSSVRRTAAGKPERATESGRLTGGVSSSDTAARRVNRGPTAAACERRFAARGQARANSLGGRSWRRSGAVPKDEAARDRPALGNLVARLASNLRRGTSSIRTTVPNTTPPEPGNA